MRLRQDLPNHQRVDIDHADAGTEHFLTMVRILGRSSGRGEDGAGIARRRTQLRNKRHSRIRSTSLSVISSLSGHLLGVLEPSVVLQVNSDAGCSPGVTSKRAFRIPKE